MANVLKPKRSNTSSLVPTTSNLTSGEMGVNMADQKIYINNGTSVVQIGSGKLSGHVDVNLTSLTSGQVLQWNGTSWANVNAGTGTVTGVTATSPVASSGGTDPVISLSSNYGDTQNPYASKTANYFLAAPNGSAGAPTFRAIVAADIPTLNQNTTGSSGSCTGNAATATTATKTSGYALPDTGGTASWIYLGRWSCGQAGQKIGIKIFSAAGYNASIGQNQLTEIYFKTSNGSSFQAGSSGNFYADGNVFDYGIASSPTCRVVQIDTSTYDFYASFSAYTGNNSFYNVTGVNGTWTNSSTIVTPSGNYIDLPSRNIINSATYNSYSPTLTGTGASGTWGINISGNAGSAGSATTATNQSGGSVNATSILSSAGVSDTYSGLRLVNPGGGALITNSGAITGAIKVKLPTASLNSSTMIRLTIKIYEYNTGYSRTFEVGGYNYGGTNWYNWFATQSSQSGGDMTVRFGQDATSDCIWIGETSTVWQYPQVFITDVQCGYSSTTQEMWASGWAVSFVTAFDTVEQSTVAYRPLSSGNYNSYAPTLTGGGASGTWGINISGNAATATTATNLSGGTVSTTSIYNTGWYGYTDGIRDANNAAWNPNVAARSVRWFFANASSTGTGGNYSGVMQFNPWDGATSSTGDASYQIAFGSTAANGGGIPQINIRKGIDTTWNSWYTLLHSGNYNSYAPTLTGTGASGTWDINVTGSAGATQRFMSTSHPGAYWLVNNWDGTFWNITSNHGAGIRVAYADSAGTATNVFSGTYTPTQVATNTNVTTVSFATCQYMRVGNVVTVSGRLGITATATGNTVVRMSFPIASATSTNAQCGGVASNTTSTVANNTFLTITTDTTNDCVQFQGNSTVAGSLANFWFTFTYQVA